MLFRSPARGLPTSMFGRIFFQVHTARKCSLLIYLVLILRSVCYRAHQEDESPASIHVSTKAAKVDAHDLEGRHRPSSMVQNITTEPVPVEPSKDDCKPCPTCPMEALAPEHMAEEIEEAVGWQKVPLWQKRVIMCVSIIIPILAVCKWQSAGGRKFSTVAYLPRFMHALVPKAFQQVEDIDHLALIGLFCVGIGIFAYQVEGLMTLGCAERQCVGELVGVAFLIPCIFYVYTYIGSYDDRLCSRQQEAARKKKEMEDMYTSMLDETEAKLKAASDSSAGLAESSINSFKRDFERFLSRVAELRGEETANIEAPIRRLIQQWLLVLEETTLDPAETPRRGGPPGQPFIEILETTADISEAAKKLKERLREELVGFIATEQNQLAEKRNNFSSLLEETATSAMGKLKEGAGKIKEGAPDTPLWMTCCIRTGFGLRRLDKKANDGATKKYGNEGEEQSPPSNKAFPCKFMVCCFEVLVISPGHFTLLIGGVLGPCLAAFYLYDGYSKRSQGKHTSHVAITWALIMFSIALWLINAHIERIDVFMRLEKEIEDLDRARENILEQRVRIRAFFGKSQCAVDFWLSRTIPLLELLNEFQQRLKDEFGQNLPSSAQLCTEACDNMGVVLDCVGPRSERWQNLLRLAPNEDQLEQRSGHEENNQMNYVLGRWVRQVLQTTGGLRELVQNCRKMLQELETHKDELHGNG